MRLALILLALAALSMGQGCPAPQPDPGNGGSNGGRLTDTGGGTSGGSGPHLEQGGLVIVEAEHFTSARSDAVEVLGLVIPLNQRSWYVQNGAQAGPGPDPDGFHAGASGNAYVECLPDTRVTHDDPFEPGAYYDGWGGAAIDYVINFQTPGTYYVWVRAYSSGTEDNGLHVGVNGDLAASGMRIQRCGGNDWTWTSAQRDSGGSACGVNGTITVTIPSPGLHTITFHQREDGFELDRFILTTGAADVPQGAGPRESVRQNQ